MRRRLFATVGVLAATTGLVVSTLTTGAVAGTRHDVRVARAATSAFATPPAARRAGYGLFKDLNGVACIAMPKMGAMGIHFVNGSLVDDKIQLRHPEALVYRFGRNGYLHLAALEYLVTVSAWRQANGADAKRPVLFGHKFNFTPAGNRYGLPGFYSLHAWVWYDNPAGRFQMWNPRVHCPTGV